MTELDFISACYLGLHHPSTELGPWNRYTTGAPARLVETVNMKQVSTDLAALQGTEQAMLERSTLHAFIDCMAVLRAPDRVFVIDRASYPISHWALHRSSPRIFFGHHDTNHLRRRLAEPRWHQHRPVIVTDGLCGGCGELAPLYQYVAIARSAGGVVLVDDTQGLGLIGSRPTARDPYGHGGSGSLSRLDRVSREIITVSSLAKGLGVPVAAVAGPTAFIEMVERRGPCRTHCSPPSTPDVLAAAAALRVNRSRGDRLRRRLATLVSRWQVISSELGLITMGAICPVQRFDIPGQEPSAVLGVHRHERYSRRHHPPGMRRPINDHDRHPRGPSDQ